MNHSLNDYIITSTPENVCSLTINNKASPDFSGLALLFGRISAGNHFNSTYFNSFHPIGNAVKSGFSSQVSPALYSHSIVAGGLLVISYTTRLTCPTSLTIRAEIFYRMSQSMRHIRPATFTQTLRNPGRTVNYYRDSTYLCSNTWRVSLPSLHSYPKCRSRSSLIVKCFF